MLDSITCAQAVVCVTYSSSKTRIRPQRCGISVVRHNVIVIRPVGAACVGRLLYEGLASRSEGAA